MCVSVRKHMYMLMDSNCSNMYVNMPTITHTQKSTKVFIYWEGTPYEGSFSAPKVKDRKGSSVLTLRRSLSIITLSWNHQSWGRDTEAWISLCGLRECQIQVCSCSLFCRPWYRHALGGAHSTQRHNVLHLNTCHFSVLLFKGLNATLLQSLGKVRLTPDHQSAVI